MAKRLKTFFGGAARLLGMRSGIQRRGNGIGFPGSANSTLPGFTAPPPGTFDTYRRMSAHPTIALVRSIVTSPVCRNQWDWVARPDAPIQWLEFARDVIEPLRPALMRDGLRGLDFGFFAGEIVWEERRGRWIISRVKPLLPDITTILADKNGNVAGVENLSGDSAPVRLETADGKAFLWSYDAEAGNPYGRSRHENVRERAWSPSLQVSDRPAQYLKKVAGLVIQLHYPEGTSRDESGAERSNDFIAQQILDAVSCGRSVRLPNLFASVATDGADPRAFETAAALAGKSQWVRSAFEAAGSDHAHGLISALEYFDKLMFRGWLRPERVGLEAIHGSKAEAAVHTDTGELDSAMIDADFADAITQGLVNPLLVANFGEQARNAVSIAPNPLTDISAERNLKVIQALLANSQTAGLLASRIDADALLSDLEIPLTK
jgi:hypothetical protein